MDVLTAVAAVLLSLVGGVVHRLTGMGFALLAVPPLVLLAGPSDGVTLAAFGALLASVLVGIGARGALDRSAARTLSVSVLIGCPVGVFFAVTVPDGPLSLTIAAITLLAVLATMLARFASGARRARRSHRALLAAAGVVSGAMNATSGIGGPPISVVASWAGMPHVTFVATAQLPFVLMGLITVGGRLLVLGAPAMPAWAWPACVAAVAAGVALGKPLSARIPEPIAWVSTLVVAAGGALALIPGGLA